MTERKFKVGDVVAIMNTGGAFGRTVSKSVVDRVTPSGQVVVKGNDLLGSP